MSLTESAKKFYFGHAEPQQLRDYSAPNDALLYEGYATPGISEDTSGWIIVKHSYDGNGADDQTQPKIGLVWSLRAIYNYNSP